MSRVYYPKGHPKHRPDTRKGDRHAARGSARSGKVLSKWKRARFVGWDTEGANVNGVHSTIVVANNVDEPLMSPAGVSSLDILDYMTEHADQLAVHVSFVFSYDVNMILGDLPRSKIAQLWLGQYTYWEGYRLEYRPRKSFSVYNLTSKRGLIIWDVFGFCQTSFVKAIQAYDIKADLERIAEMKRERSTFRPEDILNIADYCQEECILLAELAHRIRDYFDAAGLQLQRFDGAGAAASALLTREGVAAYRCDVPRAVEEASRYAYFGGRVEAPQYGNTTRKVYRYDINSAYPSAAVGLPCLKHGQWNHDYSHGFSTEPFALYRVRWNFERENATIFPFPWRAPDGRVYFPPKGEGWYWAPEVEAAFDLWKDHYVGNLEILERWVFVQSCRHAPFRFLPELYRQRQEWKAAGIGAEKALKLAMNSIYGKLAQQVGVQRENGKREPPRWHTLTWAGFITSTTRARVYRAAMQAPEDCLMIATDAVYSTKRLKLECGKGLGVWDPKTYDGFTLVQSGVYWAGKEREEPSGSRGFDALSLERSAIIDGWKHGQRTFKATHTKFVGMGEALSQNWAKWRTWQEAVPRELQLSPFGTKREPLRGAHPHLRLEPTLAVDPRMLYGTIESAPLTRPWDSEPSVLFTTREDEESDAWRW